ncbi:hypothetical protein [uncultured Polaribacter sp.]|nr:hypothetical protein [uncultured Polaribacter sp.]
MIDAIEKNLKKGMTCFYSMFTPISTMSQSLLNGSQYAGLTIVSG